MTSTQTKALARAIQKERGINYTTALRVVQAHANETPTLPSFIPFQYLDEAESVSSRLYFGTSNRGQLVSLSLREAQNLFCTGATGSGKTNLLQNLVFSSLQADAFFEVSIIALKHPHNYDFARPYSRALASNIQEAHSLLTAVQKELNEIREMYGASSFTLLPMEAWKKEDLFPRRHVVFIDGLEDLLRMSPVSAGLNISEAERKRAEQENELRSQMDEVISSIARYGKFADVSIVATSQKPEGSSSQGARELIKNSGHIHLGKNPHKMRTPGGDIYNPVSNLGSLVPPGRGAYLNSSYDRGIVQVWLEPGGNDVRADRLYESLGYNWSKSGKIDLTRPSI